MGGLLLCALLIGTGGCSDPVDPSHAYSPFGTIDTLAATDAPRDSALAVLTSMNRAAFDSAFAHLGEHAVTRYVRTEQLDTTGTTTAFRALVLRYSEANGPSTIQWADSAGTFGEGGLLASITPSERPTARPPNVAAQALPDQPAYVAPRTREAYRYQLAADTLPSGAPAYVLEAKARPQGEGTDQDVRYARLTIHRPSRQLVGLTVARASQILLFREHSLITVRLRRPTPALPNASGPSRRWLPYLTHARVLVDVPLRAPRQFRTVSAYYGYGSR